MAVQCPAGEGKERDTRLVTKWLPLRVHLVHSQHIHCTNMCIHILSARLSYGDECLVKLLYEIETASKVIFTRIGYPAANLTARLCTLAMFTTREAAIHVRAQMSQV